MMLGNDDKTSGSDLLTLAEKYLQSNKQMTDKHYSSATYEQQVFNAHREA